MMEIPWLGFGAFAAIPTLGFAIKGFRGIQNGHASLGRELDGPFSADVLVGGQRPFVRGGQVILRGMHFATRG
jgi:hypothetical protein